MDLKMPKTLQSFTFDQLQNGLIDIVKQLHQDQWLPDYVVGIVPGGIVPAVMLADYLSVPVNALHVDLANRVEQVLRDCNIGQTETNCWMSEDAIGYNMDRPCNILIVLNTNHHETINWIKQDWQSSCQTGDWSAVWGQNVRFAALIDDLSSDSVVDYSHMELEQIDGNIEFIENIWWKR